MRRCGAEDGYMNANSDKDYIDAKVETMHTLLDERLGGFREVMDERLNGFREALDERLNGFRAVLDERLNAFQVMMNGKFEAQTALLRAEMAQNTAQLIKWMVGVWIGGIVLFITVMAFVLNNAIPKAPPVQPAPTPVIIQLPPQISAQSAGVAPAAPAVPPKP